MPLYILAVQQSEAQRQPPKGHTDGKHRHNGRTLFPAQTIPDPPMPPYFELIRIIQTSELPAPGTGRPRKRQSGSQPPRDLILQVILRSLRLNGSKCACNAPRRPSYWFEGNLHPQTAQTAYRSWVTSLDGPLEIGKLNAPPYCKRLRRTAFQGALLTCCGWKSP